MTAWHRWLQVNSRGWFGTVQTHGRRPWWTYWRWWLWVYRSAAGGYYCTVLGWRLYIKPNGRVGKFTDGP